MSSFATPTRSPPLTRVIVASPLPSAFPTAPHLKLYITPQWAGVIKALPARRLADTIFAQK
jgi:hypothetical protein